MMDANQQMPVSNGHQPGTNGHPAPLIPGEAPPDTQSQMQGQGQAISADEIALYDRQIRLWGVKAQEKLRTANVLLLTMKALANEVAKNLVLAGVGSLTIQDSQAVTEDDLGAEFFISEQDIGKNRAQAALPQLQKLNPRVALHVETDDIRFKDETYFIPYTVVLATDLDLPALSQINAACRLTNKPFYAASTHGVYGFIFADLIMHDYVIEREKSNRPTVIAAETTTRSIIATSTKKENGKTIEMVSKREIYSPIVLANSSPLPPEHIASRRRKLQVPPLLSCLRALWEFETISAGKPGSSRADIELFTTLATEKHKELQLPHDTLKAEYLRSFLQNMGSEIAPVTAFLGGQLAQDVINVVGQREQPIQNFLLFDGEESKGPIFALHPVFDAGVGLDPLAAAPGVMPAMGNGNGGTLGDGLV